MSPLVRWSRPRISAKSVLLPAPLWPSSASDLAAPDLERDGVEGEPRAERLRDPIDLDHGLIAGPRCGRDVDALAGYFVNPPIGLPETLASALTTKPSKLVTARRSRR